MGILSTNNEFLQTEDTEEMKALIKQVKRANSVRPATPMENDEAGSLSLDNNQLTSFQPSNELCRDKPSGTAQYHVSKEMEVDRTREIESAKPTKKTRSTRTARKKKNCSSFRLNCHIR